MGRVYIGMMRRVAVFRAFILFLVRRTSAISARLTLDAVMPSDRRERIVSDSFGNQRGCVVHCRTASPP
ncbi:hypothetical protein BMG00_12970 [Thioclava marina]|uniref:Secreted protein n=1 Tax=Thioclava marina TaxID=1915077 RepID=A0ABX3MLA9_9RHOB|nr:hypothetical protein BMG00_12970 [Thioclava marina]